jgi:hypothetical protein
MFITGYVRNCKLNILLYNIKLRQLEPYFYIEHGIEADYNIATLLV